MSKLPRKALITGISGQDGRILTRNLLKKGIQVVGTSRDASYAKRLFDQEVQCFQVDWTDFASVSKMISEIRPDWCFHLAAFHHSSSDLRTLGKAGDPWTEIFETSRKVNLDSTVHLLQAIAKDSPETKFFYASSAHVFGDPHTSPQNEETPMKPNAPYGINKVASMGVCRMMREKQGLFACSGILYNHESPFRGDAFVTTHIVKSALRIRAGLQETLDLRDPYAVVDWCDASDTVEAMTRMLELEKPDDYIIASGVGRQVQEFAQAAFESVGLPPPKYEKPAKTQGVPWIGDSSKLRQATGWKPEVSFETMVDRMVAYHKERMKT